MIFDLQVGFKGILTLSSSLVEIGGRAFAGSCFDGTLSIPASMKEIGDNAFAVSSGFPEGLMLPDGLTKVGSIKRDDHFRSPLFMLEI